MSSLWPWLTLAGPGALHVLKPASLALVSARA
jgi:hypothetical protein